VIVAPTLIDGKDLRREPIERKAALTKLLRGAPISACN
jgi:hypothetical protein